MFVVKLKKKLFDIKLPTDIEMWIKCKILYITALGVLLMYQWDNFSTQDSQNDVT